MLLQFSDLQTNREQTRTENAACNSFQPHATGLTKGISDSFSQMTFFSVSVVFGNNPQMSDLGFSVSHLILTLLNYFQCYLDNTCIEL